MALVSAGTVLGAGAAAWLVSRWGRQPELEADAVATLRAVVDTLVPRDEHPGALDLGIDEQILARLRDDAWRRRVYGRGLAKLSAVTAKRQRRPFHALPEAARAALLKETGGGYGAGAAFFNWVRHDTLRSYYSSPEAYAMLGYRPPKHGYLDDAGAPPGPRSDHAAG